MSRYLSEDDKVLLTANALYRRKISVDALVACLKSGDMEFWSPHVAAFLTEVEPKLVFAFADRHGISNEELADAYDVVKTAIGDIGPAFGLALASRNQQSPIAVQSKLVLDLARHGISTGELADAYRVVKTVIGEISSSLDAVLAPRDRPETSELVSQQTAAGGGREHKTPALAAEIHEQNQESEFGGQPLDLPPVEPYP